MKKLILLLLFIPIVFSCDKEAKESVYSFGEDTWLINYDIDNKIDITNDSELDYVSYLEFKQGKLHSGFYSYFSYNKELSKEYENTEDYYFEDEKRTILCSKYDEGNDIYYHKLKWKNKDSIYVTLFSIKEKGIEKMNKNEEAESFLLLRKPKYSSIEARRILTRKKNDLDLQLIKQKQYDSIKNKLSRYITD